MKINLTKLTFRFLLLSLPFLWSCEDVFESDITGEKILLQSPGDSILTHSLNIQFQWEALTGAREYRVQIATPTIQRPASFFIDTVIQKNSLGLTLPPGRYEWQVQGLNAGYKTAFSTRTFSIDSSASLTNQTFNLISPIQGFTTKNPTVTFNWENVPGTTKYLFQLLTTTTTFDTIVYSNQVKKKLASISQNYSWKVTALNSLSLKESSTFQFSVDLAVPVVPDLRFPSVDTAFFSLPIKFSWNRKSSDATYDSLFILDSQFRKMPNFPKRVNATNFSLTSADISLAPGTYFWGVKSIDRAGNVSLITSWRRFFKQ